MRLIVCWCGYIINVESRSNSKHMLQTVLSIRANKSSPRKQRNDRLCQTEPSNQRSSCNSTVRIALKARARLKICSKHMSENPSYRLHHLQVGGTFHHLEWIIDRRHSPGTKTRDSHNDIHHKSLASHRPFALHSESLNYLKALASLLSTIMIMLGWGHNVFSVFGKTKVWLKVSRSFV